MLPVLETNMVFVKVNGNWREDWIDADLPIISSRRVKIERFLKSYVAVFEYCNFGNCNRIVHTDNLKF